MLKFKVLLWALTKLLQRTVERNPKCATYVNGKELVFQIQTHSGIGRHFSVRNGRITSVSRLTSNPKFALTFSDASRGFAILSAKDGKEAFLSALRDEELVISGDFVEVMWFQGLTEFLKAPAPYRSAIEGAM